MIRILGIDPGSVKTGVGIIDAQGSALTHVAHAVIAAGSGTFPERLRTIFDGVAEMIHEYRPDEIAVEDVFLSRNPSSALKLGQARGAAICAALSMQKPVAEYAARQVKQAVVGRGAADKQQIQHMICILLKLKERIAEDAADALGVAVCHAHHQQTASRLGAALASGR